MSTALRYQRAPALDEEVSARVYVVLDAAGERLGWVGTPVDGGWVAWDGDTWEERMANDVWAHNAVRQGFARTRGLAAASLTPEGAP